MSLLEKPSIYNQASIYNQGGASSSVDVNINGVVTTLVVPPYLVPVEYIDSSDYTANLQIGLSSQIPAAADSSKYMFKAVLKQTLDKMTNDQTYRIFGYSPYGKYNNNYELRASTRLYNGNGLLDVFYGFNSNQFSAVDFSKKLTLRINAAQKRFTVSEENGATQTYVDSRSYPSKNFTQIFVFNYNSNSAESFKGRFYYAWITKDNVIISALIPCRSKDTNDKKPYIADVVSGAIGVNNSENLFTTGIEFGPDIDLDDFPNYFD